jgi:hypothetical protein
MELGLLRFRPQVVHRTADARLDIDRSGHHNFLQLQLTYNVNYITNLPYRLTAYPNNPAVRKAMRAQAKCSKAR